MKKQKAESSGFKLSLFKMVIVLLIACLAIIYAFDCDAVLNLTNQEIKAYNERKVILDAGHGGHDVGSENQGLYEKDVTLDIVLKIGEILKENEVSVEYTRSEDVAFGENESLDLRGRIQLVNESDARYLVSIHVNSFETSQVKGFEIFADMKDGSSVNLANKINEELANASYTNQRGVFSGNHLYMIKKAQQTPVLVEVGFIKNEEDYEWLNNEAGRQMIAEQIAKGILKQMM